MTTSRPTALHLRITVVILAMGMLGIQACMTRDSPVTPNDRDRDPRTFYSVVDTPCNGGNIECTAGNSTLKGWVAQAEDMISNTQSQHCLDMKNNLQLALDSNYVHTYDWDEYISVFGDTAWGFWDPEGRFFAISDSLYNLGWTWVLSTLLEEADHMSGHGHNGAPEYLGWESSHPPAHFRLDNLGDPCIDW